MRFALLLLPLLAASAAAQTSQPTQPPAPITPPEPVAQSPVSLKPLATLEDDGGVPTVLSSDGKWLVYVKKVYVKGKPAAPGGMPQRTRQYVFVRCDGDGKNPTEIFTTKVSSDDMLVNYSNPRMFSADGKLLVLPTADRPGRRAEVAAVVLNESGDQTRVQTKLPWAMGFGYAGQDLVVLEGASGFRGQGGYRLVRWAGKTATVVEEKAAVPAFSLRVSPDGKRAAVMTIEPAARSIRVRVVDLKTKQAVESPAFRSDDVTFDGPPVVYWDAKSAGVYYHAIPQGGGKSDCVLTRFDVAAKTSAPVVPFRGIAVTAVLDANHLAVLDRNNRRSGILRLSDQALFPIPGKRAFVMGGRGTRIVIYGRDPQTRKRAVTVADFTLPKANPTKKKAPGK